MDRRRLLLSSRWDGVHRPALRFDQDAYWGLGIGASIASRMPVVGASLVKLMLGGPIIAGATLSRFFAIHAFIVPGLLIGFIAVHVLLVLKLGVNEWPMPGRVVRRDTYAHEYHELTRQDGVPFAPNAIWKDIVFSGFVLLAIAGCAFWFGPFGPGGEPDPTIIQIAPRPDFFFLWLYAVLSFLPPSAETPLLLIAPLLIVLGLLALPSSPAKARRAGDGDPSRCFRYCSSPSRSLRSRDSEPLRRGARSWTPGAAIRYRAPV